MKQRIPDFDNFLFEGFSNVDGKFLQFALDEFDKHMLGKNPFSMLTISYKTDNGKDIIVKVKFNKKFGLNDSFAQARMNPIKIEIGIKNVRDLRRVKATLAHELTHISQLKNGLLDYERSLDKEYNEINHQTFKSEQEAVLVMVFVMLKDSVNDKDSMKTALSLMYGAGAAYMQFSHKDFIKNAYKFGVPANVLKNLKEEFIKWANSRQVSDREWLESTLKMLDINPDEIEDA